MAQSDNIIVSSLPDYVQTNRDVIVDDIVLRGPTIKRMAKQTGIKKSAYLNYLNVAPVFQNGAGCGFTPQGDIALAQKEINVGVIKINLDLCPESLRGKYAEYLVRTRAGEQPMPFEAEIVGEVKKFIQEALEKAIWQGDTTSLDDNLAQFDGLLKLAAAAVTAGTATSIDLTGITSPYAAIDAIVAGMPAKAKKMGGKVYVEPSFFESYLRDVVALNLYHYSGPQNEAPIEFAHPGTNVVIVSTEGLDGSAVALASYDKNLCYGTDMENDMEVFDIKWDEKEEQFHLKVKWASGVQFYFDDRVAVADLSNVGNAPAPGAALNAIASGVATIATKSAGLDNLADIKTNTGNIATNTGTLADANHVFKTKEQA